MMYLRTSVALLLGLALAACATATHHPPPTGDTDVVEEDAEPDDDPMRMVQLPGGWHAMGMAHVYPALTMGAPFSSEGPLRRTEIQLPHAAAMVNVQSPDSRWVLRLMPNFEGVTLSSGEATFGGWGEGFLDRRHPHTLLHEAMLSFNWRDAPGGGLSLSAGRGFAPYGTEDPMYRPVLKYPTNHHLSQILERWTANVAYLSDGGWSIEAGIFDGTEPEEWTDLGNIDHFGSSWSARLAHRFGGGSRAAPAWEASASIGRVRETHGDAHEELTELYNAALRHSATHSFGSLYALAEASKAQSPDDESEDYFSILAEAQVSTGPHEPFVRVEYATRPEYPREGAEGDPFFRYDHDDHAIGATRWRIGGIGYRYGTGGGVDARPFVELQHHSVSHERGPQGLDPESLYGTDSFWSVTVGARIFLGGGPMRMGTYGVLDPMTADVGGDHDMEHRPLDHPDHRR